MIQTVVFSKRVCSVLCVSLSSWEVLFYLPWIAFIFVNEVLTLRKKSPVRFSVWLTTLQPRSVSGVSFYFDMGV